MGDIPNASYVWNDLFRFYVSLPISLERKPGFSSFAFRTLKYRFALRGIRRCWWDWCSLRCVWPTPSLWMLWRVPFTQPSDMSGGVSFWLFSQPGTCWALSVMSFLSSGNICSIIFWLSPLYFLNDLYIWIFYYMDVVFLDSIFKSNGFCFWNFY